MPTQIHMHIRMHFHNYIHIHTKTNKHIFTHTWNITAKNAILISRGVC